MSSDETTDVEVATDVTSWPPDSEPVEPSKSPASENTASTVWLPTASVDVVAEVAWPEPFSVTGDPKSAPSTLNCTEPTGVAVDGAAAVTVAVKDTGPPNTDGLPEVWTEVEVPTEVTVCVIAPEVEPSKSPASVKTAVMSWSPTASSEVDSWAGPSRRASPATRGRCRPT